MHDWIAWQVKRIVADEEKVELKADYKNLGSAYYDLGPVLIVFNYVILSYWMVNWIGQLSYHIGWIITCITYIIHYSG